MSKMQRARKNRLLKEKHSPHKRLERITELRRVIKFYKNILPTREKEVTHLEITARWGRMELKSWMITLGKAQVELNELLRIGKEGE